MHVAGMCLAGSVHGSAVLVTRVELTPLARWCAAAPVAAALGAGGRVHVVHQHCRHMLHRRPVVSDTPHARTQARQEQRRKDE